jgi:hypothetical protein
MDLLYLCGFMLKGFRSEILRNKDTKYFSLKRKIILNLFEINENLSIFELNAIMLIEITMLKTLLKIITLPVWLPIKVIWFVIKLLLLLFFVAILIYVVIHFT